MRLLCETVVRDVLPAVRSLIAKELQAKGYTQTEIAEMLGLTQPAVSQYLSAARGSDVQRLEEHDEVRAEITDLIDSITAGRSDAELSRQFCRVCLHIRESDLFEASYDDSEDLAAVCDLSTDR